MLFSLSADSMETAVLGTVRLGTIHDTELVTIHDTEF